MFLHQVSASVDLAYQGFLRDQSNPDHFDDQKKRTGGVYQRTKSCESKSNRRQDEQHHQECLPFARR